MNWLELFKQVFPYISLILGDRKFLPPTPDTESITGDEVRILLGGYTNNLWISDGVFKLMTVQSLKAFLASDTINRRPYLAEKHDCDDYAYELMGHVSDWNSDNTFGIVWGLNVNRVGHAWNFFIDETKKVWYVEPQTDSIFVPSTEKIWLMVV